MHLNPLLNRTTAHEILAAARRACVAAIDNVEIATADDRNASQNSTPLKLRRRIQSLEAKLGETKAESAVAQAASQLELMRGLVDQARVVADKASRAPYDHS